MGRPTSTAAARYGNLRRLILTAARSSSVRKQLHRSARCSRLSEPRSTANCTAPDDFFDAALALDLKTGEVKWSKKLQGADTWTVACLTSTGPNPNCPVPSSPDFDLGGSGPNLVGNIVGFGQKSGIYWALNPDDGNIVWSTPVGPGASLGGIEWGTAADGAHSMSRSPTAIISLTHWCPRDGRLRGEPGVLLTSLREDSLADGRPYGGHH